MIALMQTTHYATSLSSGKHISMRLRRGLALTLTDDNGDANVAMVIFNAENLLERYNAPDTLKCQHTFHLTKGHCLYSDMGRILASITKDSYGGHESICGNNHNQSASEQFGPRTYQRDRNEWHQNGTDAFLVELAKYGLDKADLPSNINWFNRCVIAQDGSIDLDQSQSSKSSAVTLRMEMDCLVLLHTCPHPLYQKPDYPRGTIQLTLNDAEPVSDDDICLNSCDENRRGFENNRLYHLGKY